VIQPLRTVHRAVFLAWTALLPVVFGAGLLSRHQWPQPPSRMSSIRPDTLVLELERTAHLAGVTVHARLLRSNSNLNELYVQLVPEAPLVAPDVLVYWSAQSSSGGIPIESRLLGAFRPLESYPLPDEAKSSGFLFLYSPAHQELLGAVPLGGKR